MWPNDKTNQINEIYQRQVDTVYRVCISYCKNIPDTEDCVSDTFMKLIKHNPAFNDIEHEKAWLIRTATNICKNRLKHWSRQNVHIEECEGHSQTTYTVSYDENLEKSEILDAVRNLPEKLRIVVYLYYYEGYNSVEIAKTLKKPESTVRKHLKDARLLLKDILRDYDYNEREEALL